MKMKVEGVQKIWDRYKYAALVALIGVGLLLWPSGESPPGTAASGGGTEEAQVDMGAALEDILGKVSGVGQVRVLLAVDADGERQLAQDTELQYRGPTASPEDYSRRSETVVVNGGSGSDVVTVRRTYPTYRGALVVCQGGDRAEVRLAVTEAVTALTGLTADRVTVAKWQS